MRIYILEELSLLPNSSSEDRYVRSCVPIPVRGRPLPLACVVVSAKSGQVLGRRVSNRREE